MGAWGFGSDENDYVWDLIGRYGIGFGDTIQSRLTSRAEGINLPSAEDRAMVVEDIIENSPDGSDIFAKVPGVAIFLLKLGCSLPVDKLRAVHQKLMDETPGEKFPQDVEERKEVVKKEIEIIDFALSNAGCVPGQPIGIRPIVFSRSLFPKPFYIDSREPMIIDKNILCQYCKCEECCYVEFHSNYFDGITVKEEMLPNVEGDPSKGIRYVRMIRRCMLFPSTRDSWSSFMEECNPNVESGEKTRAEYAAALERTLEELCPAWTAAAGTSTDRAERGNDDATPTEEALKILNLSAFKIMDLSVFYGGVGAVCAICSKKMPTVTWRIEERSYKACCGGFVCAACDQHRSTAGKSLDSKIALLLPRRSKQAKDLIAQQIELYRCPCCKADPACSENQVEEWVVSKANEGCAWAQIELGINYSNGFRGVRQNHRTAAKWFKRCADLGHPAGICMYAESFEDGNGVPHSFLQAKEWNEKAAELGFPRALTNLGDIYHFGRGVRSDTSKAAQCYKLAADQGYSEGLYNFAVACLDGKGAPQNNERAMHYFTQAAEQGDEKWSEMSMYNLAFLLVDIARKKYGSSDITGQCPIPKAMKLLRRAAKLNHPESVEAVAKYEEDYAKFCVNCYQPGPTASSMPDCEPLRRCSRCKLMQYCSKDCQSAHWKAGHKKDCVKQEANK